MEKFFVGRSYVAVDLENYSGFALPCTCFSSEVSITVDVFVTLAGPSDAPAADVHAAVLAIDHDVQAAAGAVLDHACVAVVFGAVSVVFSAAAVVVAAIVNIDAALVVFQSVSHIADAAFAGEENSVAIAVEVAEVILLLPIL